jgi:hypothetical protein
MSSEETNEERKRRRGVLPVSTAVVVGESETEVNQSFIDKDADWPGA